MSEDVLKKIIHENLREKLAGKGTNPLSKILYILIVSILSVLAVAGLFGVHVIGIGIYSTICLLELLILGIVYLKVENLTLLDIIKEIDNYDD